MDNYPEEHEYNEEILEEEPVLTSEEIAEAEVKGQADFDFHVERTDDKLRTVVFTVLSSETAGIKVVTRYKYVEELEDGKIVGRLQQGVEKKVYGMEEVPEDLSLWILEVRPAERGR